VERVRTFAQSPNCAATEIQLNVLREAPEMVDLLAETALPAFIRSPLAMGLLAGRITRDTQLSADDVRGIAPEWLEWFADGRPTSVFMDRVEAVRGILTEGDRTMVEGALGWLWARSPWAIPIPGFRTPAQVEANAAARGTGPLSTDQMVRIDEMLGRGAR
jgi:aryl-alcohol dehydrogenase-like predicted oxidoreductase